MFNLKITGYVRDAIIGSIIDTWCDLVKSIMSDYFFTLAWINTYHAGIGFTEHKMCLLSQISDILMSISRINEPIPGMFVLI